MLAPMTLEQLEYLVQVADLGSFSKAAVAVKGIDPESGFPYDDTKGYIEASTILGAQDKHKVHEGNARRVFPRLDAALKAKGKLT
jgi:4-oxalmesaconate hydratase